jgi:hypothetical protein
MKDAQANIEKLMDERMPLASKTRAMRNEVGPIRYVAEMIYGQDGEKDLEAAIRAMILLLVFVIDPLAVLLIIAASKDIKPREMKLEAAVMTDGNVWEDITINKT